MQKPDGCTITKGEKEKRMTVRLCTMLEECECNEENCCRKKKP